MTISPDDLLELAKKLSAEPAEVYWRASASRSYYAGHHRAKHLAPKALLGVKGGIHEALIQFMIAGAEEATIARKRLATGIGYRLQSLRGLRVSADYQLDTSFSMAEAARALKAHDALVDDIKAFQP